MKVVDRVASNALLELLRTQLLKITFGELEEILASPMGQTLRNERVATLFHGTRRRRIVPPPTRLHLAFVRLERELALVSLPKKQKLRGRRSISMVLAVLVRLIEMGSDDLIGSASDIIKQIDQEIPGLGLLPGVVAKVLRAITLGSSGLVTRPSARTWQVHLAELGKPTSNFYRQFCATSPRRRHRRHVGHRRADGRQDGQPEAAHDHAAAKPPGSDRDDDRPRT